MSESSNPVSNRTGDAGGSSRNAGNISSSSAAGNAGLGAPAALSLALGRMKDAALGVLQQSKPWMEVVDRSSLSRPNDLSEATTRLRKNAAYFRINYLIITVVTCLVIFLMNPSSLLVLGLLVGAWIYLLFVHTAPVQIGGRTLSEREKLLGMASITIFTIFFLTSVGTLLFSALGLSAFLIALHGSMREPDNLFVDDGEMQPSIMGILTGSPTLPTSNSGPSAV